MGLKLWFAASEEAGKKRKCETFGDEMKGLKPQELEKLLKITQRKSSSLNEILGKLPFVSKKNLNYNFNNIFYN